MSTVMSKAQSSTITLARGGAEIGLPQLGRRLGQGLARAVGALLVWQHRAHQRAHLSELEGRLLADMGVSPGKAAREAAKPFWRA